MGLDLLLRNGLVVDGTGRAPRRADVGVERDRIVAVEPLPEAGAVHTIDCSELVVTPGFVDAHVHGETVILSEPVHAAALHQGVTTYVIGQDGTSLAPGGEPVLRYMHRYFAAVNGKLPDGPSWRTCGEYLSEFDGRSTVNVAMLVPNGNLRLGTVGHDDRPASVEELRTMRRRLASEFELGAIGLSTGLDYVPSRFADTPELVALSEVVAEHDAVYVSHLRANGPRAAEGLAELRTIGAATGARVHASHLVGDGEEVSSLLDDLLDRGVDLSFDSYPYKASSSILGMIVLPNELQSGNLDERLARLRTAQGRAVVERAMTDAVLDRVVLASVPAPEMLRFEGLTLREAARIAELPPAELVCRLCLATDLAVGVVLQRPSVRDTDIRGLLRHRAHVGGSDGIFVGGKPHPRGWGAFARFLGRHVRELGDWDLQTAVAHLAAVPARRMGLRGRGTLEPGCFADIVAFDFDGIEDNATYHRPRSLASGVRTVVVNGTVALQDGVPTGATPGRGLRK